MADEQKFYICKHCGNIIGLLTSEGAPMSCCGEKMAELAPNTVDASAEKHLPAAELEAGLLTVKIGSAPHPMEVEHAIKFVYVKTERGGQRKNLKIGEKPELIFSLYDDIPEAVYAYCNRHGLWKTELRFQ